MHDPVQRLADMDLEGIDTAVLFGTSLYLSLPFFEDLDLAAAAARVYNDWVAEYCAADPRRLKGVALVPIQDPPAAVEELRHAVRDLGFVAVGTPAHSAGRNLDDPALDPFFAEAERLGVPVCVHVGAGRPAAAAERFTNAFMVHVVTHAFEQMIAALCIVSGGVLERHPALRVAFLEAGAGWVPYWIERLDEHYEYMRPCVPWLTREPGEYMRSEQCYYAIEPDERTVSFVCDFVGEERIVWASDYNHGDCKFPHTVEPVLENEELSEARKRRLLGENAMRLYGLRVTAKLAGAPR
jgi:predicted TIM-barrel fold metal-dependent hydrolase